MDGKVEAVLVVGVAEHLGVEAAPRVVLRGIEACVRKEEGESEPSEKCERAHTEKRKKGA